MLVVYGNRYEKNLIEFSLIVSCLSILQSPGGYSYLLFWAYVPFILQSKKYSILLLPFLGTQLFLDFPILNVSFYNGESFLFDGTIDKNIFLSSGVFVRLSSLIIMSFVLCIILRNEKNARSNKN